MAVIDCVTFFNELDILEIRLRELYDTVDRFVLVEATHTHAGQPKPLYFEQHKERFKDWLPKIRHIIVHDLPAGDGLPGTRRREMAQRNAILRGLFDADDTDVVLISDVDEIPRRSHIPRTLDPGVVAVYDQTLSYYNLNTTCTNARWRGTRAAPAADVRALSPHVIRYGLGMPDEHYPRYALVEGGGWHLSYFGDVAHIQQKMTSFLHQELIDDTTTDPGTIAERIAAGVDAYGRDDQQFEIGPAADLPVAVLLDPMRWVHLFHPDWRPDFHEDWYSGTQALVVAELARHAPAGGALVEIGCWEGRSAFVIAQAVAPRTLHCVDHWRGNEAEGDDHPATVAARERDVYRTFRQNMTRLTAGEFVPIILGWEEWITGWRQGNNPAIAFLHLDAAHDYQSVFDCLEAVKPHLIPGAILCGDDWYHREVMMAVTDALGERVQVLGGRLWVYQHD
ncbi:MAG TPA: class I SAM-dependent methyltransferase [Herpetosiphonaceae bacterium]